MAELTISSEEIRGALERYVSSYTPETSREEVGVVTDAGDGIAHVEGLPSTMANELLEFSDGTLGVALNLDVREIGVVILGDFAGIEEGQAVKRTGRVLSVPVGDNFLGRVVDPLGRPIDGLGDIEEESFRELELQAPNVMARQPVSEPLQTGIKAIDSMIPIGRGQRELIIGDRKTGKTTVAIDTIINQRDNWASGDPKKQVRCIYVAIGQKASTVVSVKGTLEEHGALEYTTIVSAPASDPAGFKYLAPYTGSAIGQHWMYAGKHVLIVFDDLSKQAEAYRAVSLLLRRPPGREAYPGDVFYLHSRLLERCAKLSDELGGGSMTGLPLIETQANDISAYIPTNVISITDGQIFLESDLFNAGVRPAINVGISVSRVGGNAQVKPMRRVAGRLRLDLAQFRELEAFSAFASDLDKASRAQLERGGRLVELLKQSNYSPYPVEEQTVSIWAGTSGKLDDIPLADIRRFEGELLQYLRHTHKETLAAIAGGQWDDDIAAQLESALDEFKQIFRGEGKELRINEPAAKEMEEGVETREAVRRQTRPKRQKRHARPATDAPAADPFGEVDEEDHQGAGARRDQPDRQGPGAGGRLPTVRGCDHPGTDRPRVQRDDAGPSAVGAPGSGTPGRRARHHERPGAVRRVQRQRDPYRRAAHRAAARGREGDAAVRDRPQGRRVLPVPQPAHRGELDRLFRAAGLRPRPGGRRDAHQGVRQRCRRLARPPGSGRHAWRRRAAHRLHPVQVADDADPGGPVPRPDGDRGARGRGAAARVRVRARSRGAARRAAAQVHQHADLRRAARLRGQRVGVAAAGDEERDRQRRRAAQEVHAGHELRASGRDHPGDQ